MSTPLPPSAADPETAALDQAEAAIQEGREQVAEQRDAAIASADSAAARTAIEARFDELNGKLDTLAESVRGQVQGAQAGVSTEQADFFRNLDAKLDRVLSGGGAGATDDGDDGIVSIEEVTDDIGEAVGGAADAASDTAESAADFVDKAPQRGHALFRRRFGG
jgi:ElaB/YqjD/DUF883 family membrane-anchored ribosome-binding protein